jgi:hypothetical protein
MKSGREERFRKLAGRIEELRRKDEEAFESRRRVLEARRTAVQRLWDTCRNFSDLLNGYIGETRVVLTPPEPPEEYDEDRPTQFVLNARGRILLLELRVPSHLVSRENFNKPYIFEGDIRFFNQELLESERVEEHSLFFCPGEGDSGEWVFFNGRSYKSGVVDVDYLASLLEQIL